MKKRNQIPAKTTCPYCFAKFAQDEVCFLVPAADETDMAGTRTARPTSGTEDDFLDVPEKTAENEQNTQRNERDTLLNLFRRRERDEELERFWRDKGGKAAYEENLAYPDTIRWNSPLVTPESQAAMTKRGYERDADGFVFAVHDKYSDAESRVRLCPFCHNTLPEGYGKYETLFISVVGITFAGKTIYLRQLIGRLERYLQKADLSVEYMDEEARRFIPINEHDILPGSTTVYKLCRPITVTVADQATGKYHTLVFYDISGENCVDPEGMRVYGPYIERADAILMLIAPAQFPQLRAKMRLNKPKKEVLSPSTTLQTMKQNFLSQSDRLDNENRVKTPIAFTISKSDELDDLLRQDPVFKESILTKTEELRLPYSDRKKRHLVDYGQITRINGECFMLLRKYGESSFCDNAHQYYANSRFFAVSALGCATNRVLTNVNPTEGGEKVRLKGRYSLNGERLSEVVIELEGDEQRNANLKLLEEIWDKRDKAVLCYDLNNGLINKTDGKLGTEHGKFYFQVNTLDPENITYTEVYLDKNGIAQEGARLLLAQAPATAPSPRRVEEPLLWLLAEKGLVPKYDKG